MKHSFIFKHILLISCLTLLVLFSAYSLANAKDRGDKPSGQEEKAENEESRVESVPGGPGFVSISSRAFYPNHPVFEWMFSWDGVYNPSSTYDTALRAPVNLPHGAIVNKVVFYFYDNYAESDLFGILYRFALSGSNSDAMLMFDSSSLIGGYGQKAFTEIGSATIDNQNYSYFVILEFPKNSGSTIRFTGLRIDYEFPGYLPCVTK